MYSPYIYCHLGLHHSPHHRCLGMVRLLLLSVQLYLSLAAPNTGSEILLDDDPLLHGMEHEPTAVAAHIRSQQRRIEKLEQKLQVASEVQPSALHGRRLSSVEPALPSWATCADSDDDVLTDSARSIGISTKNYSCSKALLDGACGLAEAQQLCPVTCDLCPQLSAWTFVKGNPKSQGFCLASSPSCDFTTPCGGHVMSAIACQTAGIALGLAGNLTALNDNMAPQGCFYVLQESRLYWNINGSGSQDLRRYNFAKSICRWQDDGHIFTLPAPRTKIVVACGVQHALLVYNITAQAFEPALAALQNQRISKFMLQIGEGEAWVDKQISFTGIEDGTVVVLAGAPGGTGLAPRTSINLGGNRLVLASGIRGVPICMHMEDLRLHSGKADKIGEEGGAILAWSPQQGTSELSLLRCHIENCMSRLGGGALMVARVKLKASHCVFRNNRCLCVCLTVSRMRRTCCV